MFEKMKRAGQEYIWEYLFLNDALCHSNVSSFKEFHSSTLCFFRWLFLEGFVTIYGAQGQKIFTVVSGHDAYAHRWIYSRLLRCETSIFIVASRIQNFAP